MAKATGAVRPMGWLVLPCRVVLGGLFILAGVMKLLKPMDFAQAIEAFKLVPKEAEHLTVLATYAMPWLEVLTGLCLVVGFWTRASAALVCALLVAFIGMIASVLVRGLDVKCGCFGKFEYPCTGPIGWCQIVRDVVMLGMGLVVVAWGPGPLAVDRESTR